MREFGTTGHARRFPTVLSGQVLTFATAGLGISVAEEPWVAKAVCAQTDPDAFYPEKGGSTAAAKAICEGCEVRDACLEYSLAHDERFGIWGGLSERERRRLKRDMRDGAA